jgi:hypothetical protein
LFIHTVGNVGKPNDSSTSSEAMYTAFVSTYGSAMVSADAKATGLIHMRVGLSARRMDISATRYALNKMEYAARPDIGERLPLEIAVSTTIATRTAAGAVARTLKLSPVTP